MMTETWRLIGADALACCTVDEAALAALIGARQPVRPWPISSAMKRKRTRLALAVLRVLADAHPAELHGREIAERCGIIDLASARADVLGWILRQLYEAGWIKGRWEPESPGSRTYSRVYAAIAESRD